MVLEILSGFVWIHTRVVLINPTAKERGFLTEDVSTSGILKHNSKYQFCERFRPTTLKWINQIYLFELLGKQLLYILFWFMCLKPFKSFFNLYQRSAPRLISLPKSMAIHNISQATTKPCFPTLVCPFLQLPSPRDLVPWNNPLDFITKDYRSNYSPFRKERPYAQPICFTAQACKVPESISSHDQTTLHIRACRYSCGADKTTELAY